MKNIDTLNDIDRRFRLFSKWDCFSNEWETYGVAFSSMDDGRIRLVDIINIASQYGITESVIRMRRRDWIAMRGGK